MFLPISIVRAAALMSDNSPEARFTLQGIPPVLIVKDGMGAEIGRSILSINPSDQKIWANRIELVNNGLPIQKLLENQENEQQLLRSGVSGSDTPIHGSAEDQPSDQRGTGDSDRHLDGRGLDGRRANDLGSAAASEYVEERPLDAVAASEPEPVESKPEAEPAPEPTPEPVTEPVAETSDVLPVEGDDEATDPLAPLVGSTYGEPFTLSSDVLAEDRSPKQKARDNILATRILKSIEASTKETGAPREATLEEKVALARYVGWGGLPNAFRSLSGSIKEGWEKIVEEMESIISPAELAAARRTTLDAYYTSANVVGAIYEGVQSLFRDQPPRAIHEPSVGTGNFIGLSPYHEGLFSVAEMDPLTAGIASILYPEAKLTHAPYQEVLHKTGPVYDLVVGNPPFGDLRISDEVNPQISAVAPNTHSYFFAKGMDKLAPGGVLAMVVTHNTLDSRSAEPFREHMARQSHLLGAIRLPRTAFEENAGTQVVTDIIFLQKREHPIVDDEWPGFGRPSWVESAQQIYPNEKADRDSGAAYVNRYFLEHPNHVCGTEVVGRGMYRGGEYMVLPKAGWEDDMYRLAAEIVAAEPMPSVDLIEERTTKSGENDPYRDYPVHHTGSEVARGSYILIEQEGKEPILGIKQYVYGYFDEMERIGYTPVKLTEKNSDDESEGSDQAGEADPFERLSDRAYDRMVAYIPIRDTLLKIIELQVTMGEHDDTTELDQLRADLNRHYDNFVDKFKFLNTSFNASALSNDPHYYRVSAIEDNYQKEITKAVSERTGEPRRKASAEKSAIFRERTQFPAPPMPTKAENAKEALSICLSHLGAVEPAVISKLAGVSWDEARAELDDAVLLYEGDWKLASEILAGDVRTRIEQVEAALEATGEQEYSFTIEKLKEALPPDVPIHDIAVTPGAFWLPRDVVNEFLNESFGLNAISAQFIDAVGSWDVSAGRGLATPEFTTFRVSARQMANNFLARRMPVVRDKIDEETTVVNEAETELARSRMDALNRKWNSWITAEPDRVTKIEQAFNTKLNRYAPYITGAVKLELPGRGGFQLRPTQYDGAWRITQSRGKGCLLDHAVGAGKTATGVAGIHESIRLNLARKAMITMPNGLEGQWAKAFMDSYPSDRVIVATKKDMTARNRQRFLARVASAEPGTVVLIPHSSFTMIPRDPIHDQKYIEDQINSFQTALAMAVAKSEKDGRGGRSVTVKAIEKKMMRFREKLKKAVKRSTSRDQGFHMGNIGIDMLLVDESQNFKNISFITSMQVSGLGSPDGSSRADDMMIKCRTILENNGIVVDTTGTPEANTIAETYLETMKMAPQLLDSMGIFTFDQFAAAFAEVSHEFNYTLTGGFKEKAYLNTFVNLDQLRGMIQTYRHSVTIEDVRRLAIEAGMGDMKLPKLDGDKPQIVVAKPTPLQRAMIGIQTGMKPDGEPIYNPGSVLDALANMTGKPEKGQKNTLTCIGDLNKIGLSAHEYLKKMPTGDQTEFSFEGMHHVFGKLPENEPSPKLDECADRVLAKYGQWNEDRGTQIVFLDYSTPNAAKGKVNKEAARVSELIKLVVIGSKPEATDEEVSAKEDAEETLSQYTQTELDDLIEKGAGEEIAQWSAYVALREKLVEKGIPENEIAFVHDHDSADAREELFGRVRSGSVRILMGSTTKMGAGVNVQDRLVAMHMLDAPWRPDQMEQRIGRMLRQGNLLLEKYGDEFSVGLYYYVTEGSADAGRYQTLENKKKFLDAIRPGSKAKRAGDPDASAFNPSEIMAQASGSQTLRDRAVIKSSLMRAENLLSARLSEARMNKITLEADKEKLADLEQSLPALTKGIAAATVLSEKITAARTIHEDAVAAYRATVSEITAEHRAKAGAERERITTEMIEQAKAKGEPEPKKKDIVPVIDARLKEMNAELQEKIKAIPDRPGEGPYTISWADGTVSNGLTVTEMGEEIITRVNKATNHGRAVGAHKIPLFTDEGLSFEVWAVYRELSGMNYTLAVYPEGVEGNSAIYTRDLSKTSGDSAALSTGLMVTGAAARYLSEKSDPTGQIERLRNRIALRENEGSSWNERTELDRIDFMRNMADAVQSMMRCGLHKWEDGVDAIAVARDEKDAAETSDEVVRLMKSQLRDLAGELLPPFVGAIEAMATRHDEIMAVIQGEDAVPSNLLIAASRDENLVIQRKKNDDEDGQVAAQSENNLN